MIKNQNLPHKKNRKKPNRLLTCLNWTVLIDAQIRKLDAW
jgi:hypothetical protein